MRCSICGTGAECHRCREDADLQWDRRLEAEARIEELEVVLRETVGALERVETWGGPLYYCKATEWMFEAILRARAALAPVDDLLEGDRDRAERAEAALCDESARAGNLRTLLDNAEARVEALETMCMVATAGRKDVEAERDRLRAEVAEWQNRFQMEEHALAASESLSNELRWANEASLAALAEARGLLVRWLGHSREFQPYADTSAFLGRTAPPPEFGCRFESCPGHYVENEECAVTEAAPQAAPRCTCHWLWARVNGKPTQEHQDDCPAARGGGR